MVRLDNSGMLYWQSPKTSLITGRPLEYKYSVLDCKPGNATLTRNNYSITVSVRRLWQFKQGTPVQYAFPDLSDTDREFLITGMNPAQQDEIFNQTGNVSGSI
jgi:hypothetical protein